jgi:2-polyprenyl-6-methoxyphenol hydroxylase-like FAD-dependent oxidoreductase
MAGLTAARVLSVRYDRVTIVDRDALPDSVQSRRGVPQGAHAHALLAVGREALETLFPGLTDELVADGARWVDVADDVSVWQLDGYRVRTRSGVDVISLSRPLLETRIRERVAALPNVTIRPETAVAGLTGRHGERVTGIALAGRGPVPADLVVDASGRGSRSDRWLADLGFPAPTVSTVTVRVGYTTRTLRRSPGELNGDQIVVLAESPPDHKRFGAVFAIDGDRWLMTLGGFHGDHAPTDPDGYLAFADSLPGPQLRDLLRTAEPLTDPVAYQYPMSRRRHFERLRSVPAGYVAVGDALCSVNPVYGHGMTVATLEAIMLGDCLDQRPAADPLTIRTFYRRAARLVDVAWTMANSADFAYRGTQGHRPRGLTVSNWYLKQVILATHVSPAVVGALLRVQHLMEPGTALLRPAMIADVLRGAHQARRRLRPPSPAAQDGQEHQQGQGDHR